LQTVNRAKPEPTLFGENISDGQNAFNDLTVRHMSLVSTKALAAGIGFLPVELKSFCRKKSQNFSKSWHPSIFRELLTFNAGFM
jgi:hypothetical protein